MLENRIKNFLETRSFLQISCAVIFLFSIFLRSIMDIGPDTGVYIDLGRRILLGQKYYHDFFENNFPLSFYFYALEYKASTLLHISPIIMSEIVINLLALSSIFWSSKILKSTTIYQNKAHYNLIIISFFLGFFLRPIAIEIGEFGTKTSLLLILLYPYISYSFVRTKPLDTKDLICRGVLMGLMPCIKPHYAIFIIFIEFNNFLKAKSIKFFFELDNLLMCLIMVIYFILMVHFTLDFFQYIIPMAQQGYPAYSDYHVFLHNFVLHLSVRVLIFALIFLIFSRLNFSENDKILTLFFAAAATLIIVESISTSDQVSAFYAVTTICFAKFLYDLFSSKDFSFTKNKFIIIALIFLPIFDYKTLPIWIFGIAGFVNIWWLAALFYPFLIIRELKKEKPQELLIFKAKYFSASKKIIALVIYFLMALSAILSIKILGKLEFIAVNLTLLFLTLFFFEKKIYAKFFPRFSTLFIFIIMTTISCLFYSYVKSTINVFVKGNKFATPNELSDDMAYYTKTYAPKNDDKTISFSVWIAHGSLIPLYFHHEHNFTFASYGVNASYKDSLHISYFFSDSKKQLQDPRVKVLFFNNDYSLLNETNRCFITTLEYYLSDIEFRKIFLKNFHFENRLLINQNNKLIDRNDTHDFEVYVRN
jgi:hypothetical protein